MGVNTDQSFFNTDYLVATRILFCKRWYPKKLYETP